MHFATFKISQLKKDDEVSNIKKIRLTRVNMTQILRTRKGKIVGIFEDNTMLRIIKEYRYVLYIFDPEKGG